MDIQEVTSGAVEMQQWHKGQRTKLELHLGSKETFYEALGQTVGLQVVKRAVRFSIGLRKVSDWTLWRS
jgi:hypothetical protein